MEKICAYCKFLFTAARKDALYCSPSCRQMAYINRNMANSLKGYAYRLQDQNVNYADLKLSIDGFEKKEASTDGSTEHPELSIDTSNKNVKASIDTLEKNTKPPIDVFKEKQETSIDSLIDKAQSVTPKPEKQTAETPNLDEEKVLEQPYVMTSSKFLQALVNLISERNNMPKLMRCMNYRCRTSCQSIGKRLKCLTECLLLFSETKYTELEDLKEVCNAFTLTIGSEYFQALPILFPYTDYMVDLRDKLKHLIIDNRHFEKIIFRLSTEHKLALIATRYELSHFCSKKKFSELDFSE